MTGADKPLMMRDRCEVCNRVIDQRPDARKRRCAEHLDDLTLFPASVCKKKPKRANSSRQEGGR